MEPNGFAKDLIGLIQSIKQLLVSGLAVNGCANAFRMAAKYGKIEAVIPSLEHDSNFLNKKIPDRPAYIAATFAAETPLRACVQARIERIKSQIISDEFKSTCISAIESARPILKKYREWGKVLSAFLLPYMQWAFLR